MPFIFIDQDVYTYTLAVPYTENARTTGCARGTGKDGMVTSRDVARLAGVSQATVSRALAGSSKVSPDTLLRIQKAMATLNYVPHAGAQAMKTRRTHVLGLVVAEITNPFYAELLDELTQQLHAAGYRLVIWNAGATGHGDALTAIAERAVDGVIFTTATDDSPELHAALAKGSPLVLINRIVDNLDCDQVTSDNYSGGVAVADYLVDNGRVHAAYIGGLENASTSRQRGAGFLDRMAERGHPVAESLRRHGAFSHDSTVHVMTALLGLPRPPEAVFCANDFMAFGALDAVRARDESTQLPVWVIGYDDVEMAAWASLSLTTVRQPSRDMARAGARMLLQRLDDPTRDTQRMVFPSELIVRKSTQSAWP